MTLKIPFNLGRGNGRHWELARFLNNVASLDAGMLRVTGNVASGETVTIGKDVFSVEIVNTNSAVTLPANLPNNANPVNITLAGLTLVVGDLIRVGTELFRANQVFGNTYNFTRAFAGSSAGAHTAGDTVVTAAVPGATVAAGKIPVGLVTTLTPAAFIAALVPTINFANDDSPNPVVSAFAIGTTGVYVVARNRGSFGFATTETLANGAWDAVKMAGGKVPSALLRLTGAYTVVAADVTEGNVRIPYFFDQAPTGWIIQVRTAAGVIKQWDGAVTNTQSPASTGSPSSNYNPSFRAPGFLTLDNTGATDFAATDVINYIIFE